MALLFLALLSIIHTVASRPPTSATDRPPLLQTDITFNVSINNNSHLSYHDVEILIDTSGEEYLDELLVDKPIEHALDFDIIEEEEEEAFHSKLIIVHVHIILYSDAMNRDKYERNVDQMRGVNGDDLRSKIQYESDIRYGKHTLNVQLRDTITTVAPISHTDTPSASGVSASYLWYLVTIALIVTVILLCCVIACNIKRQPTNSSSTATNRVIMKPKPLDLVIVSSKADDTKCSAMNEGNEREILVERMVSQRIYNTDEISDTDSEKLYEVVQTQGLSDGET
eukprot:108135_1